MIVKWILVAVFGLLIVADIMFVGEPRKAKTPNQVAAATLVKSALIVSIIIWL